MRKPEGSYEYFKKQISETFPNISIKEILFEDGVSFNEGVLPQILSCFSADDAIYLETAGGKRDTGSQLMLLSHILVYQGTALREAVYTDFQKKQIISVLDTYKFFDLINGLNEFQRTCSVESLINYYKGMPRPKEMDRLLDTMELLSECILLSRTELLKDRFERFETALEAAQKVDDPMLQILLPIFRDKFCGMDNTPGVIRWCIKNNMLQQALTIYNERMPEYIIKDAQLLQVPDDAFPDRDSLKMNAANPYRYALMDAEHGFLSLGKKLYSRNHKDYGILLNEDMYTALQGSGFKVNITLNQMKEIFLDFRFVALLRNQLNHDSEAEKQEELARYLHDDCHYPERSTIKMKELKNVLNRALNRVQNAKQTAAEKQTRRKK